MIISKFVIKLWIKWYVSCHIWGTIKKLSHAESEYICFAKIVRHYSPHKMLGKFMNSSMIARTLQKLKVQGKMYQMVTKVSQALPRLNRVKLTLMT